MMLLRLTQMLKQRDYNVMVIYRNFPILADEFHKANVPIMRVKMTKENHKFYLKFLKDNFDLAITSCDEILFEHSKINQNMPTIWWAHKVNDLLDDFSEWSDGPVVSQDEWYFNPLETLKSSDIVTVSNLARRSVLETGVPPESVSVIINGIGAQEIIESEKTPSSDLYQQLEAAKENKKMMFIFVGRAVRDKGIHILAEAIASLPEEYAQKVLVYFIGKNDMPFAELMMEKYAGVENIIWVGEQKQNTLWDYYRAADVMVVPSIHADAAPCVVAEAAMYHMPSIITENVGSDYLVQDGKSGFIIASDDVEALREKLIWAIDHRKEVKKMGKAAYQKFLQTSMPQVFLQKWEEKIQQKLQESKNQRKSQ